MGRLLLETGLRADQRTYAEAITQSGEALLHPDRRHSGFLQDQIRHAVRLTRTKWISASCSMAVVELLGPRAHAKLSIEVISVVGRDVPRRHPD